MTDAPVMMKDGLARPSAGDMRGWLLRGEVLMALGVIGIVQRTDARNPAGVKREWRSGVEHSERSTQWTSGE